MENELMKELELKSFTGLQSLTGLDRFSDMRPPYEFSEKEPCEVVRFTINGKTYEVYENPSDGYRSSHVGPKRSRAKLKNTFDSVSLLGIHQEGDSCRDDDIINFVNLSTGKSVLLLGTRNLDDYYPSFVCEFSAEELNAAAGFKLVKVEASQ